MGRNKLSCSFKGFEEMIDNLERLQGDLKKTTEEALISAKEVVTKNLLNVTNKANYPAQGKYSHGKTRNSIDTDRTVVWTGDIASIKVGFDLKKSGLTSIFLMHGTPRHSPPMKAVPGMYDAVYGSKTKSEIKKLQKEIFANAIKKKMEG